MKKLFCLLAMLLLLSLTVISCGTRKGTTNEDDDESEVTQEDEQARENRLVEEYTRKYEYLIKNGTSDLNGAIANNEKFLDIFTSASGEKLVERQPVLRSYIYDINSLNTEFMTLKSFFNDRVFNSLSEYNSQVAVNASRFTDSKYAAIRESYQYVVPQKRKQLADAILNMKVDNFTTYLQQDAENLRLDNFRAS